MILCYETWWISFRCTWNIRRGCHFHFTFWRTITTEVATLQWRHNERDGVSNHRRLWRLYCLLNRLFRHRSKNIKAPRHWPLGGESTGDRWNPLKGPVTREIFPFDDVTMSLDRTILLVKHNEFQKDIYFDKAQVFSHYQTTFFTTYKKGV